MERINCPLCGTSTVLVQEHDGFGIWGMVLSWHTPGPAAVLSRRDVRHSGSMCCLGSGLEQEFAEAVAADRRAGRHLTPHP